MKRKLAMLATAMTILVLAAPAGADIWTGYASGNLTGYEYNDIYGYSATGPVTVALDINAVRHHPGHADKCDHVCGSECQWLYRSLVLF